MKAWTSLWRDCVEIVRQSGGIVREHWSRPSEVRHKGRIDLVTQTDLAVEAFLKERLGALLPEAAFLAEESSRADAEPTGLCWIIDPVDGTTNFVHRIPQVGTSVALWHEGRAELGVVNVPMLDQCFYAARGEGAFCNEAPIAVSRAATLADALVGTGFPYDFTDRLDRVLGPSGSWALPRTQGCAAWGRPRWIWPMWPAASWIFFMKRASSLGFCRRRPAGGRGGRTVSNLTGAPLRFGQIRCWPATACSTRRPWICWAPPAWIDNPATRFSADARIRPAQPRATVG